MVQCINITVIWIFFIKLKVIVSLITKFNQNTIY